MVRRSISRRRYKKSTDDEETKPKKSKPTNIIPQEMKDSENKRCSSYNGNQDDCRANNCWYFRDSKKCKMHTFYVADKIKGKSKRSRKGYKKRYSKKSTRRKSKKRSGRY